MPQGEKSHRVFLIIDIDQSNPLHKAERESFAKLAGTTHETMASNDPDTYSPNINSLLVNPFRTLSHDEMNKLIDSFMDKTEIDDMYREYIRKGAFLAQDKNSFDGPREDGLKLKPDELETLKREDPRTGNKWNQPWILYALVACCSLGAAVQGRSRPENLSFT